MTIEAFVPTDPLIKKLKDAGQLEQRFTQAVRKANTNGFATDLQQQSRVLWEAARLFQHVDPGSQNVAIDVLLPCVPRAQGTDNPTGTMKNILCLPNQADIYRCLTVGVKPPRKWVADKDELRYPTDGWLGAYLTYARNNQCNLGFHFWAILCIIGAICQRNYYYDMGQFKVFLNTYTILTGSSASGKSIARKIASDLLKRFNRRMLAEDASTIRDVTRLPSNCTPAYLIEFLDNRAYSYVGPNGLEEEGLRDATAFLELDELATFLNKGVSGIEEKVPMLVELQDADDYQKGTQKDGHKSLVNCGLSMLALSAPEWFKESITPAVRRGGLMDRMLFIHRDESSRTYTLPLDPNDPLLAENLVCDMMQWAKQPEMVLEATPAAHAWMENHHIQFANFRKSHPSQSDYERSLNRQIIMTWRVAGLLAVTYGEAPYVSEVRFAQALKLLEPEDVLTETLMQSVEEGSDGELFTKIEKYVERKGGCASHKDITNSFYRRLRETSGGLKRYLGVLIEAGRLTRVEFGRTTMYRLDKHDGCKNCQLQRKG